MAIVIVCMPTGLSRANYLETNLLQILSEKNAACGKKATL